jgi:signal transduction histidine kinase/CheY-like chemotaxis protein
MNILIIDDEDIVRRTLQRFIEHRGDSALVANGGNAGLEILAAHPVDLVITDVRMPDIDGMEVLHRVRDFNAEIPVIIVTAYADTDIAIQAVNEGAFAFLQKPILPNALDARLNEALSALTQRRQEHARLEGLEKTASEQRQRLEQERAFSTAVLRNIPFPVCLVDSHHVLYMTNAAFRRTFANGIEIELKQTLEEVLTNFDLGPLPLEQLFAPVGTDETSPGITVEITPAATAGETRYYYITAFSIHQVDASMQRDLTCLFFQDQTLQVQIEREQQLRDWCTKRAYLFRAETATTIHSPDLLSAMAVQLADCLGHFNQVGIRISSNGQHSTFGEVTAMGIPYLSLPLKVEQEEYGRLDLFSPDAPNSIAIQREFATTLAETAARRLESRAQQLKLLQTSQLHALGEMAAGVAHELNQPLTGIRTFAESILFGMQHGWETTPEEIQSTLADIVGQVDRMTTIINHMRDFSRDNSGEETQPFSVEEVIDNVFKLVETQLKGHDIEIEKNVPSPLPICQGWPQQLEQVLLNLITNARQAMDEYREKQHQGLEVDSAWFALLAIDVSVHTNHLLIKVADTGGGIPENIVKNIFDPFFTSKEVGQGTGLGLSISHSIVQKHGGDIYVENRPGTGATFCVSLPLGKKE